MRMMDELLDFVRRSGLDRKIEREKLRKAVIDDQRKIEEVLEDVAALEWPDNIFARMDYALERDDKDAILECVQEWRRWIAEIPPEAADLLYRTMVKIEDYAKEDKKDDS